MLAPGTDPGPAAPSVVRAYYEHGDSVLAPTLQHKVICLTMVDANQATASKIPVLHVTASGRYFLEAPSFDAAALLLAQQMGHVSACWGRAMQPRLVPAKDLPLRTKGEGR